MNRVIEWNNRGIRYEADQRHAEIVVRDAGLGKDSKSVSTPGVKQESEAGSPLTGHESSMYCAAVARLH